MLILRPMSHMHDYSIAVIVQNIRNLSHPMSTQSWMQTLRLIEIEGGGGGGGWVGGAIQTIR